MAILNNSNAISAGGYDVNNSVRLRSSASAYLSRTPASAGNRKTWTWSAWVKRGALSISGTLITSRQNGQADWLTTAFTASDTLQVCRSNGGTYNLVTTQVFRDPSAWYHIVIAWDTTQATASNRVKLYINGNQVTAFGTANYPTLNYDGVFNTAVEHEMGAVWAVSSVTDYYDGYITEVNFIDGSAKAASDFGETDATTGVWKPKAYTGTYGTNGFYLKFSDIATTSGSNAGLGKDFSGNTNYWTTNNISVTSGTTYDAMKDSPTNTSATVANYCVLNPVAGQGNGTYSDGNLAYLNGVSLTWKSGVASMGATSGKYYFEYTITSVSSSNYFYLGVAGSTYNGFASYVGATSDSWGFQWNGTSSVKSNNGVSTTVSTAGSISVNDVIQVAIDLGTGSIWWGRNNTWVQGDPSAGTGASYTNLSGTILPAFAVYTNGGDKIAANFGQRPFSYTPPTGYVALNTYNLPDSTIKKGNSYMNTVLYTGNGSTQSITGVGFSPDFIWIKERSSTSNPQIHDSIRGAYILYTNLTNAEEADGGWDSFDADGYSMFGGNNGINESGQTYVSWNWRGSDSSAVSNTDGSITSTVSVNATAGFSIVTWTGTGANATVGHGLGVAPKMIIVKNRSVGTAGDGAWQVYHASIGNTQYLSLNTTAAAATATNRWNNTSPTSTVFTVSTTGAVNDPSNNYVAYCWAEIAGFSRFGSYTGNGSTDGPFISTNFAPKFVIVKRTDSTQDWFMWDSARTGYNMANYLLFSNLSQAEYSGTESSVDLLSNGFKIRAGSVSAGSNASGGTYIYACFASNPFKNSNAR